MQPRRVDAERPRAVHRPYPAFVALPFDDGPAVDVPPVPLDDEPPDVEPPEPVPELADPDVEPLLAEPDDEPDDESVAPALSDFDSADPEEAFLPERLSVR